MRASIALIVGSFAMPSLCGAYRHKMSGSKFNDLVLADTGLEQGAERTTEEDMDQGRLSSKPPPRTLALQNKWMGLEEEPKKRRENKKVHDSQTANGVGMRSCGEDVAKILPNQLDLTGDKACGGQDFYLSSALGAHLKNEECGANFCIPFKQVSELSRLDPPGWRTINGLEVGERSCSVNGHWGQDTTIDRKECCGGKAVLEAFWVTRRKVTQKKVFFKCNGAPRGSKCFQRGWGKPRQSELNSMCGEGLKCKSNSYCGTPWDPL